jgi:hemolysin activation/secretion protein
VVSCHRGVQAAWLVLLFLLTPLLPAPAAGGPETAPSQPGASSPLPPLSGSTLSEPGHLSLDATFVRKIRVTGSTVFSEAEMAAFTAPYENRTLSAEDLEALRVALTTEYVKRGYITSGVILPDQTVVDGTIRFEAIEGRLADVEVEGQDWFRPAYFQDRLARAAGRPVNINGIQEELQILLQDPRIEQLNADLKPGIQPGESLVSMRVKERNPWKISLDFNNYGSPSEGAEQGLVTLAHQNLSGNGDVLSLQYGASAGANPLLDFQYSIPVNAYDTTLALRYRRNNLSVVQAVFEPLDIKTESQAFAISVRQPVYRRLNHELSLGLTAEREWQKDSLAGEPFSFSPGSEDGKSTVAVVRLGLEWILRSDNQVLMADSRLSIGLGILGATVHSSDLPDSQFVSWRGQVQGVRRLPFWDVELLARTAWQLSDNPLLSLEQIAVGGRYSVRGYRENQLVRDSAWLGSIEARLPLVTGKPWADTLQVAAFADIGCAWNVDRPTPTPSTIAGVGVGLRWAANWTWPFPMRPWFEIYWGFPLKRIDNPGYNLQDIALHMRFMIELL